MVSTKTVERVAIFVVVLACALACFSHLDDLPLTLWDEGRVAINSLEMYQSSNYVSTLYDGKPDMWNTKPTFFT